LSGFWRVPLRVGNAGWVGATGSPFGGRVRRSRSLGASAITRSPASVFVAARGTLQAAGADVDVVGVEPAEFRDAQAGEQRRF
jgi:hypothetical protein